MTEDVLTAELLRLTGIPDPATRALEAGRLLEHCARATRALAAVRRDAVIEMHADGMSHQKIADGLGISKQRAAQLAGSGWTHTVTARRDP